MPTTTFPPILIWTPGGGISGGGPVSHPPVYSQHDVTPLVAGQAYVDVVFGSVQTTLDWVLVECDVVNTIDVAPLNIWPGLITNRTTAGFRLYLNGFPDTGNYVLHWAVSGVNIAPTPATTYLLTGPSAGTVGVPMVFTVHLPPSTTVSGAVTVTPNDGVATGTFDVGSVILSTSSASATFSYTPAATGTVTISVTNSSSILSDPAAIIVTVSPPAATTYTLTGPSAGNTGVPSTNFTVALPAGTMVTGTLTITPSSGGGGGSFTPTTIGLTTGAPSATFTYTPASNGTKTISVTNDGGLTNPTSISYVASTPFAPTDIAGLKAWYKADSTLWPSGTPTDGASVGAAKTWPDDSGSGNGLASGTATFKTSILNGKPVVRFNGTTNLLTSGATGIVQPNTVFIVAKQSSLSTQCRFFNPSAPQIVMLFTDGNLLIYAGTLLTAAPAANYSGAFHVFTAIFNGATSKGWVDGVLKIGPADAGTTGVGQIQLMTDGTNFGNGDIAEILVYNSALGTTDQTNVQGYLAAKYGL